MQLITDVFIEAIPLFEQWIGPDRLSPTPGFSYCIASTESRCLVSECSCNLISPDYYREFVLPYDQQLDDLYRSGWIECDPNSKPVEQAVEDIGDRSVILYVREELVEGKERERIQQLIDLAKRRGRMYMSFTGMRWTPKDDAYIINLHREMDTYFKES